SDVAADPPAAVVLEEQLIASARVWERQTAADADAKGARRHDLLAVRGFGAKLPQERGELNMAAAFRLPTQPSDNIGNLVDGGRVGHFRLGVFQRERHP